MAKKMCLDGKRQARQEEEREVDEGETRSCTFTCVMSFLAQPNKQTQEQDEAFEIELCATRVVVVTLWVIGRVPKKKQIFVFLVKGIVILQYMRH